MEIDRTKYKVWDKKNFKIIHFMVNPTLAINELILGQRVPEITLIDQNSDKNWAERMYIPCPNCETYHDGRTWSVQNKTAFKNWFGLYCPNCGEIIPCIRNWTSVLILIVTYPLWFWWIDSFKQSWMSKQPKRYSNMNFDVVENPKVNGLKIGLIWGALMYVFMTLLITMGMGYNLTFILVSIPIWAVGGLAFGYGLKWLIEKKIRGANKNRK